MSPSAGEYDYIVGGVFTQPGPIAAPRDIDLLCISNDLLSLKISFRNFETMQNANDALKIFWPIRPIKKGRHSDPFYLDS